MDINADVISVKEFSNTEAGALVDSEAAAVACDARIKIQYAGTVYYIPLYSTAA